MAIFYGNNLTSYMTKLGRCVTVSRYIAVIMSNELHWRAKGIMSD